MHGQHLLHFVLLDPEFQELKSISGNVTDKYIYSRLFQQQQ